MNAISQWVLLAGAISIISGALLVAFVCLCGINDENRSHDA